MTLTTLTLPLHSTTSKTASAVLAAADSLSPAASAGPGDIVAVTIELRVTRRTISFSPITELLARTLDGYVRTSFLRLEAATQARLALPMMRMQALFDPDEIAGVIDAMCNLDGLEGSEYDIMELHVARGAMCLTWPDLDSEIYFGRYFDEEERMQDHVNDALRLIVPAVGSNHDRVARLASIMDTATFFARMFPVPVTNEPGESFVLGVSDVTGL